MAPQRLRTNHRGSKESILGNEDNYKLHGLFDTQLAVQSWQCKRGRSGYARIIRLSYSMCLHCTLLQKRHRWFRARASLLLTPQCLPSALKSAQVQAPPARTCSQHERCDGPNGALTRPQPLHASRRALKRARSHISRVIGKMQGRRSTVSVSSGSRGGRWSTGARCSRSRRSWRRPRPQRLRHHRPACRQRPR